MDARDPAGLVPREGSLPWRIAAMIEQALVRFVPLSPRWPPLFVVGVPRAGTTLAYLLVTNRYRVAYIPNVAKSHPWAPVVATIVNRCPSRRPRTYENEYGIVPGLCAASDGWDVFHRWFPGYDHDLPIASDQLFELRRTVAILERLFGGPFVNKNNNHVTRIGALAELFPSARFVHIVREQEETVRSILQGRREHGIPTDSWWATSPPQYQHEAFPSEVDQVAHLVVDVERSIDARLSTLDADRTLRIDFETVRRDPGEFQSAVADLMRRGGATMRELPLPLEPAIYEPAARMEDEMAACIRKALRRVPGCR